MTPLIILQLVLPLALVGWLAIWPARSWLGLAIQMLALGALLAALHLAGLWLMPPWWTIWVYWLLFAGSLLISLRKQPVRLMPLGVLEWAAVALLSALAAYAGWTAIQAAVGRKIPAGPKVELRFPLDQGNYLVANGGSNTSVSSHAKTLAPETARQRFYYGQSHAVDLIALNRFGFPGRGMGPAAPEQYEIFGHAVLAPCQGLVIQSTNDKPDMGVPTMDKQNMVGNHVLLRCSSADILLAHFRKGSVRVQAGQQVVSGQVLGEAGNSGNSSTPHLHIHAQEPGPSDAPFSGKPLPMTFGGRYLVRGDRVEARR
jgi:murein DD-endopeptidase MepM/ murein hydrolase activator NlpD